jgi:hypothetical protein
MMNPSAGRSHGQGVRMADLPDRIAQAVAERAVALVVDALDVNALLAKVDVDELLAGVDVSAVVERIDADELLARIDIEQLLARIDLASTMAATASTAAEDTLAVVRRTARRGDDLVADWIARARHLGGRTPRR